MTYMKSLFISLVLLALTSASALAVVPAGLADDFAPIDGLVLMAKDGEVLIDAAAVKGVRNGDLFSIISGSEKVVHPQTGEVLGEHRQTAGLLQVVQVRPGFSIARQLAGDAPAVGTRVLRFEQVEARFIDLTDKGELFSAEMRQALPQLTWSGYEQIDQAGFDSLRAKGAGFNGLLFLLEGERLEVRSTEFELLSSYDQVDLKPAAVTAPNATVAAPAVVAATSAAAVPSAATAASADNHLVAFWSGMSAKKLPVGLVVADLDGDGRQEIARAFEDRVEIGRLVGEQYEPLQTFELSSRHTGLSLSALDLNGNDLPELYVTVAANRGLASQVLEFREGRYRVLAEQQRLFLNVVDLPGEGEVLLGQEHNRSTTGFSPLVYRMTWQDGELVKGKEFQLPERGTIFSLTTLPEADGNRMVRINDEGRLEVYGQAGDSQWVSEVSGATETGFTQPDPQSPSGSDEISNNIYLPTPLLTLADGTVLTIMNQGITASGLFRQMSSVEIAAWSWGGFEMKWIWTQKFDGYIPAAVIADANNDGREELAVLLAFPTRNPFSSRKSIVRLYEIK